MCRRATLCRVTPLKRSTRHSSTPPPRPPAGEASWAVTSTCATQASLVDQQRHLTWKCGLGFLSGDAAGGCTPFPSRCGVGLAWPGSFCIMLVYLSTEAFCELARRGRRWRGRRTTSPLPRVEGLLNTTSPASRPHPPPWLPNHCKRRGIRRHRTWRGDSQYHQPSPIRAVVRTERGPCRTASDGALPAGSHVTHGSGHAW